MMTDNPDDLDILTDTAEDAADDTAEDAEEMDDMDTQSDGDRQLSTDSDAIDTGTNASDLGAAVAGDIGPKHG